MKLLQIAVKDFGLSSKDDPIKLRGIFTSCNYQYSLEVNWCGIIMHYWAIRSDLEFPKKEPEVARKWLGVGRKMEIPKPGDLCIFWRDDPSSWKGHVSIYLQETEKKIMCLGGSQGSKVQVGEYPRQRLLGFRRLKRAKTYPKVIKKTKS